MTRAKFALLALIILAVSLFLDNNIVALVGLVAAFFSLTSLRVGDAPYKLRVLLFGATAATFATMYVYSRNSDFALAGVVYVMIGMIRSWQKDTVVVSSSRRNPNDGAVGVGVLANPRTSPPSLRAYRHPDDEYRSNH